MKLLNLSPSECLVRSTYPYILLSSRSLHFSCCLLHRSSHLAPWAGSWRFWQRRFHVLFDRIHLSSHGFFRFEDAPHGVMVGNAKEELLAVKRQEHLHATGR